MHVQRKLNVEKLLKKIRQGKISRREFVATAAAAGVAMTTMPIGSTRAQAGKMINYFTWVGSRAARSTSPPTTAKNAIARAAMPAIRAIDSGSTTTSVSREKIRHGAPMSEISRESRSRS